jgi:hypothetical protein
MKKTIQILFFLFLSNGLLMAQIKMENLEKKPNAEGTPQYKSWFLGFDLRLQTVQTKVEGSANVTPVHEQYKNLSLQFGYQKGKHKWELGLAVETDDNSHDYKDRVYEYQNGFGSDGSTLTTRLGYSYQILKLNQRWNMDIGGGLNWTNSLNGEIFGNLSVLGGTIRADFYETLLKRNVLAIDGKIQLNYALTPHLQAHFFYQYRYAPQNMRSTFAFFTDTKTKQILDKAYVYSSPTAVLVGLGLQYNMKPLFYRKPKEKIDEETVKEFHLDLEYGLVMNTGSMKSTVNRGTISRWDPTLLISPRAGINAGYRYGRHDVQVGFQTLLNFVNFQYDNIENFQQGHEQGFGTKAVYLPLRYYYSLFPQREKWKIDVGAGIGLARFIEQDSTDFAYKGSIQEEFTLANNTKITYDLTYRERMDRRQTTCFEGNIRLRRLLYNEHWQFNVWGRYIYNPWSVRTVKFDIKYNNQPDRFGEVSTSFTSFGIGAGLSYVF